MNTYEMLPGVQFGVRSTLDELTDEELVSFYMHITAGWSVKDRPYYEKVSSLFTQDGGTRPHHDAMLVIDSVVKERIG